MAPPSSTTDALEAASVNFLLSTLKNTNELIVDWSQVAEDNGIKHAKNARPKFNAIVAKFGFKLEGNKIVQMEKAGASKKPAAATATPKKSTKASKSSLGSAKKRKLAEEDDDNEAQLKTDVEEEADLEEAEEDETV